MNENTLGAEGIVEGSSFAACLICKCVSSEFDDPSNKMIKLACRHNYCVGCLNAWFKGKPDSKKVCCYCRVELTVMELKLLSKTIVCLNLSNNNLKEIPKNLPETLEELYIEDNQITKIENLPSKLEELYIGGNQISVLENLPKSLKKLYIRGNLVTKLENLPESLVYLCIEYNKVSVLENLPGSLETLHIRGNLVGKIENLPSSLENLSIRNNPVSTLKNLPPGLKSLFIGHDQITTGDIPENCYVVAC